MLHFAMTGNLQQQMNQKVVQFCVLLLLCESSCPTRRDDADDVCHKYTHYKWGFFLATSSATICYSETYSADSTYLRHQSTVNTDTKYRMPSSSASNPRKYSAPRPKKKLKGSKNQRKKQKKKRKAFKSKRKGKQK